jgi:hypothetical protein
MELEIGGRTYRTGKLNAFKQLHVARRVAPVMMSIGKTLEVVLGSIEKQKPVEGDGEPPVPSKEDLKVEDARAMVAMLPLAQSMAAMKEEDVDYVLNACLSVCDLKQGDGWQRVQATNGRLMFDFIDLPVMMELAITVIKENLVPFFPSPSAPASKA